MACSCHPGSADNGWHERRCAECMAEEHDEWRTMIRRVHPMFATWSYTDDEYVQLRRNGYNPWTEKFEVLNLPASPDLSPAGVSVPYQQSGF